MTSEGNYEVFRIAGFGACMLKGYPLQVGCSFFHQAVACVQETTRARIETCICSLEGFPVNRAKKHLRPKVLSMNPDVVVVQFGSMDASVPVRRRMGASGNIVGGARSPSGISETRMLDRMKWAYRGVIADVLRLKPVTDRDTYLHTMQRIMRTVTASGARLVVLSPFVLGSGRSDRHAREYARALAAACADVPGVHYVDAYDALDKEPRHEVLLSDGLHLSARGHAIVAGGLAPVLMDAMRLGRL